MHVSISVFKHYIRLQADCPLAASSRPFELVTTQLVDWWFGSRIYVSYLIVCLHQSCSRLDYDVADPVLEDGMANLVTAAELFPL